MNSTVHGEVCPFHFSIRLEHISVQICVLPVLTKPHAKRASAFANGWSDHRTRSSKIETKTRRSQLHSNSKEIDIHNFRTQLLSSAGEQLDSRSMAQAYSQFNPNSPCIPSVLSPVLSCEQDLDQTVKVLVPQ